MKRKFKIYFHQHFFHQQELPLPKKRRLIKFLKNIFLGLFGLSYLVGEWLILFLKKFSFFVIQDIFHTGLSLKKRLKLFASREFLHNNAFMFLGVFCIVILMSGFKIFAEGQNLQTEVLKYFDLGKSSLKEAQKDLLSQNAPAASQKFSLALKNFDKAGEEINSSGQQLKLLINVFPQGKTALNALKASQNLALAGNNSLLFLNSIKELKITAEGFSGTNEKQNSWLKSSQLLRATNENLQQAAEYLKAVDLEQIPQENRAEFLQVKDQVVSASEIFKNASEIFNLFLGVLQKSPNILILMQNNNELRSGGGFIGSFAALKQQNGTISKTRVGSIYDLDGQLKQNVLPPLPMLSINNRWYLRDSNWFLDFPSNAKKAAEFYEKEAGETPDIIVTVTPNLIVDLLKITGPVEMPNYSVTLTADNFVEQTQALTTISDNNPENQPKQFLADLMPVLLMRLGKIDLNQIGLFLQYLSENLNSRQIMLYSRDPETEIKFVEFGWGGEVKATDRDYLAVVNNNFGGTKSDLFVDQKLALNTTVGEDNKVTNELTLTFSNKLPNLEHAFNRRFVRILVPKGAKLVSATGFDYKNIEPLDKKDYILDPQAQAWDKSLVKDILTGTLIGEESDKTFFGNWVEVKGGQSRTVKFVYQLPFTLKDLDHLSLYLQKQPGAQTYQVSYNLNLRTRKILWKNFEAEVEQNVINITSDLNQDQFFGMVLQK